MPSPPHPSVPIRLLALALILFSLAASGLTFATWRADSADQRKDFSTALRWRPDIALYHRELAETLLVPRPDRAQVELLRARADDPYDVVTASDLTTADLALGKRDVAIENQLTLSTRIPDFTDQWGLANLDMIRGDTAGFWREAARATLLAEDSQFAPIAERALTFTHNDFDSLRAILPPHRMAAAGAYLEAVLARHDRARVEQGFAWLLQTRTGSLGQYEQQRGYAFDMLTAAWQQWPDLVTPVWNQGRAVGLFVGPDKDAGAHLLLDGDFVAEYGEDGTTEARLEGLTSLMGWRSDGPLAFSRVLTGDATFPTAAAFSFDGTLMPPQVLALQSLLLPGGKTLAVAASGEVTAVESSQSIRLRLLDQDGKVLFEMALPLTRAWSTTTARWTLPAGPLRTGELVVYYQRPSGEAPLQGVVAISGVRLGVVQPGGMQPGLPNHE